MSRLFLPPQGRCCTFEVTRHTIFLFSYSFLSFLAPCPSLQVFIGIKPSLHHLAWNWKCFEILDTDDPSSFSLQITPPPSERGRIFQFVHHRFLFLHLFYLIFRTHLDLRRRMTPPCHHPIIRCSMTLSRRVSMTSLRTMTSLIPTVGWCSARMTSSRWLGPWPLPRRSRRPCQLPRLLCWMWV